MKQVWEIYVPTVHQNSNKPIKARYHRVWDRKVLDITGGLSVYNPIVGIWKSDESGEVYNERMIPVRIVATRDEVEKVIEETFKHYPDEEAILCYRLSQETIMRYRK